MIGSFCLNEFLPKANTMSKSKPSNFKRTVLIPFLHKFKLTIILPEIIENSKEMVKNKTYCAHENALSRASKDPPIKGGGGLGSEAIHHPTGILTVFIPCRKRKPKSAAVIKLSLCLCNSTMSNEDKLLQSQNNTLALK